MYFIAQSNLVKGENNFPSYESVLSAVQDAVKKRAEEVWTGYSAGGMTPGNKQFGMAPLRKNDMSGDTTDAAKSGTYTFAKTATTTGWADLFNYTVRASNVHGFAGFQFLGPTLPIWQIRLEIGDRKYPILDIQDAKTFGVLSFVLNEDEGGELVAGPGETVLVRGYWGETGTVPVKPLGLMAYRELARMLVEATTA